MKYENLKKVTLSYFADFSSISKKILNRTISICDSLDDESDKIFRLRNALNDCLWDIPEAVEDGFTQFIYTKCRICGGQLLLPEEMQQQYHTACAEKIEDNTYSM